MDKKSSRNIDIDEGFIKILVKYLNKMGAKSDQFCLFSAYFVVFPPNLLMKYRIFISIVNISVNLTNIDIDIDNEILENIDIDKEILENIDIGI